MFFDKQTEIIGIGKPAFFRHFRNGIIAGSEQFHRIFQTQFIDILQWGNTAILLKQFSEISFTDMAILCQMRHRQLRICKMLVDRFDRRQNPAVGGFYFFGFPFSFYARNNFMKQRSAFMFKSGFFFCISTKQTKKQFFIILGFLFDLSYSRYCLV